ncbi:hypothetical protein [Helicobacter winghamensis]|uniref:Uncharacterized protein n=1 Tax=Helicobacter winghamensis TaxID=157268 RepID=A0A2N3PK74_9HELI|nr:hypothetical protein [Helicobacter winghamensis]PKT77591.1 hypothetical protein BCM32_05200 [Helicobacter winghamensis]PKT81830.1 hypothetical protein BCM31_01195 [Helicobacter winghamensis]PKT82008.1 hypothetical protein BCM33_00460 [Helicobacter winghamensis]QOQ98595.1 hypothetical protein A0Z60_03215 [Helicobacter winghamensis]
MQEQEAEVKKEKTTNGEINIDEIINKIKEEQKSKFEKEKIYQKIIQTKDAITKIETELAKKKIRLNKLYQNYKEI